MDLFDNNVKCEFIKTLDDKIAETLLVIEPNNKEFNPIEWLKENKLKIETCLHRFGGILFREFGLYSVSEFNKVVQSICPSLLDYVYRSTPRTKLGGKIYTATEYPSDRVIPMHNENSYTAKKARILLPDTCQCIELVGLLNIGRAHSAHSKKTLVLKI